MQDLVGRLTLDEMVAQMSHGGGAVTNGNFMLVGVLLKQNLSMTFHLYRTCTRHTSSWDHPIPVANSV